MRLHSRLARATHFVAALVPTLAACQLSTPGEPSHVSIAPERPGPVSERGVSRPRMQLPEATKGAGHGHGHGIIEGETTENLSGPTAAMPSWAEGITPTAGYLSRKADYLARCSASTTGLYSQLCRLETSAGPLDLNAIRSSLAKVDNREDTADFGLNALLRMLALYRDHPALDPVRAEMIDSVLNFKYWLDEPGPDTMCWWSENHQALFHTAELVAGQLFPDAVFPNSGMTGREHVAHAIPLLHDWLDRRGRFGFSEWHSNIYFNEDIPALLNLIDLAQDPVVALKAAMVLDIVAYDFANTYFKGVFATAHGRTYDRTKLGGADDSTSDPAWVMLGLGAPRETGNFSATFLATSDRYWPPAILEDIAQESATGHEHKQRDGIDIAEGPDYGLTYTDYDDVVFWWGMGAYVSSEVIEGTFATVDYYDLWDDFFWSSVSFLEPFAQADFWDEAAAQLDQVTQGAALEGMDTYVYRTPHYQLSGAQDFNPGYWGAQTHIWQATLDDKAFVFTTYPGGMPDDYMAGDWTGGWLPRATFHENVGILQYDREIHPVADKAFFKEYTHAYFPRSAFDEVVQRNGWTFGKKGDGYVGLYSRNPTAWATEGEAADYELIADGRSNVWVVELGSRAEWGDFQAFVAALSITPVWVSGGFIEYESPSQGTVAVSASGPMFVNGVPVDIGPYERFDNRYGVQEAGTNRTVITRGKQVLELDFEAVTRKYTE